jgi:cyclophilin family peptidyl-prolyl cis-trans isomerase
MRIRISFLAVLLLGMIVSCGSKPATGDKENMVLIKTEYGTMKVKLYNETPLHRDNFLKLVKDGFYNDLLFHRVIKEFMIQGGDPESKNAPESKHLGGGGPGYNIPAEINNTYFHKKGALAAARMGDNMNPERQSSGSQFYIVQGKVYTPDEIQQMEEKQKFMAVRNESMKLFKARQAEIIRLQNEGKIDSINQIKIDITEKAEATVKDEMYRFSEAKKSAYTTLGGTPHLDGAYTVFGEVVEGFEVIDSIAKVQTKPGDRPLVDVKMKIEIIE